MPQHTEMLVELLAMKIHEHSNGEYPADATMPTWPDLGEEGREIYRRMVREANSIEDIWSAFERYRNSE